MEGMSVGNAFNSKQRETQLTVAETNRSSFFSCDEQFKGRQSETDDIIKDPALYLFLLHDCQCTGFCLCGCKMAGVASYVESTFLAGRKERGPWQLTVSSYVQKAKLSQSHPKQMSTYISLENKVSSSISFITKEGKDESYWKGLSRQSTISTT